MRLDSVAFDVRPTGEGGATVDIAGRVGDLRSKDPRSFAYLAAFGALGCVLAIHGFFGFSTALLPLYVLPIWLATHLDGQMPGVLLALAGSLGSAYAQWKVGSHWSFESTASAFLLSAASLLTVMAMIARMERLAVQDRALALRDPLTGLLNRRALAERVPRAIDRALLENQPLVLVAIDCDGFKVLNDTYGHGAGDDVLRLLGRVLENGTRESDLVARVGGDEFVIVLHDVGAPIAHQILQRIERDFEHEVRSAGYECTITVGLAPLAGENPNMETLLESADQAMYLAKETKRARAYLN